MAQRGTGTKTETFRLSQLLEWIHDGRLVLPEFQRDFEWGDDRVTQLLASVVRRWPAGSLLLQEFDADETFFVIRKFEGGPDVEASHADLVVLDGQQRLTALYHAVYDTGPFVYAIRQRALTDDATIDSLEDNIAHFDRAVWDELFRDDPWTDDNDWIPFYSLSSAADFFAWRDLVATRSPEHRDVVSLKLSDGYRRGLESFHTYTFPSVIVERRLEPAAIARIFERVNRGGLTLTTFDLMVAKSFERNWNLRDKWVEARARFPILERFFGDDGMPVIRAIALKNTSSVREGDVLDLTGLTIRVDWDDASQAVSDALQFLSDRCGVDGPEWLPYGGMVTSLAALAFEYDLQSGGDVLLSWFFSRSFALRYAVASNTVTVEEHAALRDAFAGDSSLPLVSIPVITMREATRKRETALWRAFGALLTLNEGQDPGQSKEESGTRVSLIPVLERSGGSEESVESRHLRVLNLVRVSSAPGRRLTGQGLSAFYSAIEELPDRRRHRVLRTQLLPQPSTVDDDDGFLEARLELVRARLKKLVGYDVFLD